MKQKVFVFSLSLFSFFLLSGVARGQVMINPNLPGELGSGDPAVLIRNFYLLAMALGGALAFAMVVWGGIQMIWARGNQNTITDARDRITQALFGLLILAGAYIILNTINPVLVTLTLTPPTEIKPPNEPTDRCKGQVACGPADIKEKGCCTFQASQCIPNPDQENPTPAYVCSSSNNDTGPSRYVVISVIPVPNIPSNAGFDTEEQCKTNVSCIGKSSLGFTAACQKVTVGGKYYCAYTEQFSGSSCYKDQPSCTTAKPSNTSCLKITTNIGVICPGQ